MAVNVELKEELFPLLPCEGLDPALQESLFKPPAPPAPTTIGTTALGVTETEFANTTPPAPPPPAHAVPPPPPPPATVKTETSGTPCGITQLHVPTPLNLSTV